jgi:hypothetical protein
MTLDQAVTSHSEFDALNAGGLLLAVLAICLGVGALIGLAFGSTGLGVAVGALVGVPLSVAAVVVRYRSL